MDYTYANIPTRYRNVEFRSRLEARWAAFADLADWKWRYEPVDLNGWIPDFWFAFPCGHSECCGVPTTHCPYCLTEKRETFHEPVGTWLDLEGKPITHPRYRCLNCQRVYPTWERNPNYMHELYAEVKPYRSIREFDGHPVTLIDEWSIPSPAKFGWHPSVTEWTMVHGAGGGMECAENWVDGDIEALWEEAGNRTRWHAR